MGHNTTKPNKFVALVTYSVALLCMLLGLFLPLGNTATGAQGILAFQIPAAINAVFRTKIPTDYAFTYNCPIQSFGSGMPFDIGAIFALLYIFVIALGLIAMIPIIISNRKDSITLTLSCIFETFAIIILTPLLLINFAELSSGTQGYMVSGAILIAFIGSLAMLIVQSFAYKKNAAIPKFALVLISLVAVFITVTDFSGVFTAFRRPLANMTTTSGLPYGMYGTAENTYFGADALNLISTGAFPSNIVDKVLCILLLITTALVLLNFVLDVIGLSFNRKFMFVTSNVARYGVETILIVATIIISFTTQNYSAGLMLYILLAIAAVQLTINIARLIMYRMRDKARDQAATVEQGIYEQPAQFVQSTAQPAYSQPVQPVQPAYSQPVQSAPPVQPVYSQPMEYAERPVYSETRYDPNKVVINIDKNDLYGSHRVPENNTANNPYYQAQPAPRPQPVYTAPAQPAYSQPEPAQQSYYYTPNEEAIKGGKRAYNDAYYYNVGPIYRGPTDDFIKKLNNAEKIEFSQVFLEHLKGNLPNVPNYVIGEDNTKFFTSVFIYYARIRDMISEGLMNKIYDQCNKMF